ncbi:NB-ARC domains-containing protein [Artemisia annua]|uniref:NB-ARC domains-containing protein n=1 Tax=Artemisia annua TaxID=35608 RepID=A0A2U1M0Z7_ARTAN|nr:NB-ARC domains-containing protein [Artemisia annua]
MQEEMGLTVIPIFYDVDPSEVRKQKGEFGKAFAKQEMKNVDKARLWRKLFAKQEVEDTTKVVSWKKALVAASNISGWEPKNVANGNEAAVIQNIVDAISDKLLSSNLDIDEQLVGMTDRVKDLISRLEIGKGGVRMVGIWGVGGGEALAGSHKWFGDGSRIIITTRDEHVLKTRKVDHISRVTLLSQDEGIRLFKKHAYNEEEPLKDYAILSLHVVSYPHGLPLALKVLGSFLYDKDEKEWMSTLDKLQDIPQSEILKQLRVSYDGLDSVEQELFLDIACFFRHRRKDDDAMEIFEACGFHPDIGIKVLIQKALITIDPRGNFDMHDLLQEMAHYIVRGEHPDNPEKHSRVWKWEDINKMCIDDATTENHKIEATEYYDQSRDLVPSQFFKFVSNLKKLRWITVAMSNDGNVEGPNFLSNELRYINWRNYSASPFPDSFQPMNLVVLIMREGFQRELWRSHKVIHNGSLI